MSSANNPVEGWQKAKATKMGFRTCVGYFGTDYPWSSGNCFDLDGHRILNFNYENFIELQSRTVISWPVDIMIIENGLALIHDSRILHEWYSQNFCITCCPIRLLPAPQRLKQLREIDSGVREEKEIVMGGGKKTTMVTYHAQLAREMAKLQEKDDDNCGKDEAAGQEKADKQAQPGDAETPAQK